MAFTDTQALVAQLKLDDKFSGPLKNAGKTLSGFGGSFDKISARANLAGRQIGTGISNGVKIAAIGIGFLATQVIVGLRSLVKLEGMTAQTEAVLKSTGAVSGQTAGSVRKLAEQFEALNATVGDETIQAAENLLLTFTNIRGKAFEPAVLAALNMNQALGGGPEGLAGNAKLLGKALQDPEKGLSRLGRAVGGFSDETIAAVKAAVKNNDTLGAQKIILDELEKRYGGSFARAGQTTAGKVALFTDAIEDLQRKLAEGLLPTVSIVADKLTAFLADPALGGQVTDLGNKIAGLFSNENLNTGADVLRGLFNTAKAAAGPLQAAAEVTGRVVGAAVNMFKSLPPELQAVLVGGLAVNKLTGGLVTNVAGGAIDAVGSVLGHFLERGASPANPLFVAQVGGIPGLPGGGVPGGPAAGLLALVPPIAIAAAAAVGVKAITDQTNKDFADAGRPANFMAPGEGILPFGIQASINNIGEMFRLWQEGPSRGDGSQDAIENLRGKGSPFGKGGYITDAAADLQESASQLRNATFGLDQMATAFKPPSRAQAMGEYSASNRLLGVTGPTSVATDTSLKRRFGFLGASHAGSKDVTVANALTTHFERTQSPLYRSNSNLKRAIDLFKRDQRQLLLRGDTKAAGLIGKDIARLKAELARRLAAVKAAAEKDRKIIVNNNIVNSVAINGRVFSAQLNRYVNIYSNSGQFGGTGPR